MLPLTIISLFVFFMVVAIGSVIRAIARNRRLAARRSLPQEPARCRCGYPMGALDSVRCPECGRVAGFDATADELGLTREQLRVAKARRDERMRSA